MKHKPSHFPKLLALVMLLFIGILAYVWIEAEKAAPVMLNERGEIRK